MIYKLSELFDLQMGKTPARNNLSYWGEGHKWVSISDLGDEKYITETRECITDSAVRESGIKVVPADTVIMSFKLSIGKTAITKEPIYTNEAIMAFIDKGVCKIDPEYLYYAFKAKDWTAGMNKAVMGMTLNKATISEKTIDIPDIQTQKEIADKLNRVSDLIALRQSQLFKLDELVKSQFIEMFGNPEVTLESKYVISDVADVQVGIVIQPTRFYANDDNGVKAFRSLNIGPMYIKNDDWVYFTEEAMKETQRTIVHTGDILIVRSGNPGTSCVVTDEYDGCNVIDLIIAHPNTEIILPEYLAAFTNMPHGMNQINSQQRGVAQKHFNVGMYNSLKLVLPTMDKQLEFVHFLKQSDKSKFAIRQALEKSQMLFANLMQQYFG